MIVSACWMSMWSSRISRFVSLRTGKFLSILLTAAMRSLLLRACRPTDFVLPR